MQYSERNNTFVRFCWYYMKVIYRMQSIVLDVTKSAQYEQTGTQPGKKDVWIMMHTRKMKLLFMPASSEAIVCF